MKEYQNLTLVGKIRRLRCLAYKALNHFDIKLDRLSYLGWYTNLLYKVVSTNGEKYVVRLCAPNWRTDQDAHAEGEWLDYLSREGTIQVPRPIKSKTGEYFIYDQIDGIPQPLRISVQSFLPGKKLGNQLTIKNLVKMGSLFASMHQVSLNFKPSKEFSTRMMNKVLARDEPDKLFSEETLTLFDENSLNIYIKIRDMVKEVYHRRYQNLEGLRVIHHDLWHDNIHVYRGKLTPLDFEDTVWGFPIQDIAMAVQDLMKDVSADQFDPLFDAFRQGYEYISPWPAIDEQEMDLFRLGRMLWVSNYISVKEKDVFAEHAKQTATLFKGFLDTGKLKIKG